MKIINSVLLCLMLLNAPLYAAYKAPAFGDIDLNDLKSKVYEKDNSVKAYILFDDGNTYFKTNKEGRFEVYYEKHMRLKIYDTSALHVKSYYMLLRQIATKNEVVSSFKVTTYNYESNAIEATDFNISSIEDFQFNTYHILKISFPNVQAGSIVDISYTIKSDYLYVLRNWDFQYEYPAAWSQYKISIPEIFEYRILHTGFIPYSNNTIIKDKATYTFTYNNLMENNYYPSSNNNISTFNYELLNNTYLYAATDVPAFVEETNTDCVKNYIQKVNYELLNIKFPNSSQVNFSQSWESINEILKEQVYFGTIKSGSKLVSATIDEICPPNTSQLEKATIIYKYVQEHFKWNRDYDIFTFSNFKTNLEKNTLSSFEINLVLIAMYKAAGINAYPVLISTRDNGYVSSLFPTLYNFNTIITYLAINDNIYLVDASCKNCTFDMLPINDINGEGRLVNDSFGNWIPLYTKYYYKKVENYQLKINLENEKNITGVYKGKSYDYAKLLIEDSMDNVHKISIYEKELPIYDPNTICQFYTLLNHISNDYILDTSYMIFNNQLSVDNDKISFYPLCNNKMQTNLYTSNDRKFPIDYNFPINQTIVYEYELPLNYEVESVPQNAVLKFNDDAIIVIYNIQVVANKIIVMYKYTVNEMRFEKEEYQNLKKYYELLFNKQKEKIVLKRKE